MMGSILALILIAAIIFFIIKSLIKETDYQTWLNILLVTIILLTVIMSIFMLLNKTGGNNSNPSQTNQSVQEQSVNNQKNTSRRNTPENTVEVEGQQPSQEVEQQIAEMSDDELSLLIAENYLALKNSYENLNKGKNGADYARNKIIQEYELTDQEWNELYNRLDKQGYLKQAAQNLKKDNDYLIKS
ncbi:MAG: hypothetical protein K6E94_06110 [Elusimicrobiaceae bacterium]|nr:hypothetical protein [Elusimicrobiaceae bacterium]